LEFAEAAPLTVCAIRRNRFDTQIGNTTATRNAPLTAHPVDDPVSVDTVGAERCAHDARDQRERPEHARIFSSCDVPAAPSDTSVRRTYDLLRSSLHHSLEPGALLVEDDLVNALSASRNTVRAALQQLAHQGLVTRGPKVGTTVRGSTLLPLNDLLTVRDKAAAYKMRSEPLEMSIVSGPALVRKWLDMQPGASLALIEGLVFQDETPVGLSVSYVGLTEAQERQLGAQPSDVIAFLEEKLNVSLGDCGTTIAALGCDAQTAELLGIEEGAPLLWLEDYLRDESGNPRAICQLRYRGDRVAFSATARRPCA
jgi:GntR family transcriptional regulator